MSRIVSFSTDNKFAEELDQLVIKSGYQNRSRFIRDASIYFSDLKQRGELEGMKQDEVIEGHLIVYYQHNNGVEKKLMQIRHSNMLEVYSYNHSSLKFSHTCVDVIQGIATALIFRNIIDQLQNTPHVNKISFISAPKRDDGCC
ncbi:MAG: hypothetical protein CMB56_005215 [Methanobacteriota archaeon]|nr:MAG: hypothetical protein CMB56_005215 [Euryarchaeota archaeon]